MSDPFPAVLVEMPAEIDLTNSEEIPALLYARDKAAADGSRPPA
jgi:hypothetical protein